MLFYCNIIFVKRRRGFGIELYSYSNHKVAVEQHYFLLQPGE